ncbi:cyclopropane fatty acyl phospholipid synthase [Salegentibacter chungangensis]|uniref:Cyclopropane fatty acyl phospholipid synthase n=1 Tax=Salegentibacter chungangensis TaxID=1335724 RepID=A0ABW3NQC7_9FLAO
MSSYQKIVKKLLLAAGIEVNGNNSWDLQVRNRKFYKRVLRDGSIGLGESYMEKWWDCDKPDEFLYRVFNAGLEQKIKKNLHLKWLVLKSKLFNLQKPSKALKSIATHYNKGNQLYQKMLDPLMLYSCAYWQDAENLSEAQQNKLELICTKLKLRPGLKLLDIGCGWGGFAYYAAKNYGVEVVGITISKEQYTYAKEQCKDLPVEIRFQDYRSLNEKFDRIVSIGMLEHVGHKNYDSYMEVVQENLKEDGICLLHFIGSNKSEYTTDPWINKYIFPEGLIPSAAQIGKAIENKLVLQDWHNFGKYYDKTLMAWYENFREAWPQLKQEYSDAFYRMWEFYLCSSAASFRANRLNLWQLVLTRKEFPDLYTSMRPVHLNPKEV